MDNFDAADTNQDGGKVSFQEAIAYDKANPTTSTSSSGTSTTSTSSADSSSTTVASTEKSDAQVFRQLMDLLRIAPTPTTRRRISEHDRHVGMKLRQA